MPALAPPVADERSALREYLAFHQSAYFAVSYGLTDEQARSAPSVSALSIGGLIKHVTGMQRNWMARVAAAPGAPPKDARPLEQIAKDFADQHVMRHDETLAGLLQRIRSAERGIAAAGGDRGPRRPGARPAATSRSSPKTRSLVGALGDPARDQRAGPARRARRHRPGNHRRRHHVRTDRRAGGLGDRGVGQALAAAG